MKPGAQLAQAVHAAFRFADEWRHTAQKWMDNSEYICILEIENEVELAALLEKAKRQDIPSSGFTEPDLNDSLTAVALAPSPESKKLCSSLRLALKELSSP